ncbi:uncharacterized protein LOC106640124 isoform X2 [Copidosoma floridanum]|uniref:uncharacterized protein LOC106640124 isoform X2 n=1 Tax=Copidosoma floridanum TaxID=29053 RepID=UPI0006C9A51F|nr:uncharacterized protein LOC106640124 isoform X2 [Copidosoma floridanum]
MGDMSRDRRGCALLRGTTRSTGSKTMRLHKVALLAAIGGLVICCCQGVPVADDKPAELSAPSEMQTTRIPTQELPTTTTTTIEPMIEGHPMDDLLPGISSTTSQPTTPAAPTSLGFTDVPQHTETSLGASVLLACRTTEPVHECQWSWRPLPPTSLPLPNIADSSESEDANNEDVSSANGTASSTAGSTSEAEPSLSLPVRKFPAFGNASKDCSVRFSSVKHEQTGYWSCAARRPEDASFTSAPAARLGIAVQQQQPQIKFQRHQRGSTGTSVESPVGSATRLACRTTEPVLECQWSWRPLDKSRPYDAEMRRFPPAGHDTTDCELGLPAVNSEHEGFWTCGARTDPNSPFVQAPPIRLLISKVEFVQLSRGIQITAGETVSLRCLVNKPVFECEWSWRSSNSSKNSTLLRQFKPAKDNDHDCSVRGVILYEEEGVWTCGVKLVPGGILHEAPSTSVSLLPPSGKLNFTETPESTSVALGSEATLHCATNGKIERCAWSWRPLVPGNNLSSTESKILHEFPSHGELGRNCSLTLASVTLEEQGYWTCQVYGSVGAGPMLPPSPAKLGVYEEGEVRFSELSQDFQITSGATVSLRCVTSSPVDMCRWSLTSQVSQATVVVKQFKPIPPEARDCSVKLSHALPTQEGLWTCGARTHARQNYTDAPPARLSLIEPDPITVTVWGMPHQMANLACKVGFTTYEPQCFWRHGSDIILREVANATRKMKYTVLMNHTSGVCSLQFVPDGRDFGEWICEFHVSTELMQAIFGSASILLLNNSPDRQLSWLVGAITSSILFLLIIIVVVVVYKSRNRRIPTFLETIPSTEHHKSCNNNDNNNGVAGHERTESVNSVLPNRSPHLHGRITMRVPTQRTFDNVRM